jgi:glycosyltransferase involved in cell wall biosynthesis
MVTYWLLCNISKLSIKIKEGFGLNSLSIMKVVQLQFSTESAGSAANRLQKAFLEKGIDSSILSLNYGINQDERTIYLGRKPAAIAWLDAKLQPYFSRRINKDFGSFSYPILGTDVSKLPQVINADIIYLHWVQGGFLNFSNIEKLAKLGKPVVFFLHDMFSITGGCHHSFSCEKYKTGCYNCQLFFNPKKNDLSSREYKKKLKLYSKYNNFYFVAPSQWMYECASQSGLTRNKPIFYIPNILDTKLFKPFDKKIAKQILNLDSTETIIAFGSVLIDSPYKGWVYLQKALEILKSVSGNKKYSVLIFGSGYNKKMADKIPFNTKFMGYLRDEYSISLIYNAADIFIAPSLAETFGYVIMESLACGTPVVGFKNGGIPDQIKHKENGYLAIYKDAEDLAQGMKFCVENNITGKLLPIFESDNIVEKHIDFINSIISK